jgi:hypothetical protein
LSADGGGDAVDVEFSRISGGAWLPKTTSCEPPVAEVIKRQPRSIILTALATCSYPRYPPAG